MYVVCCGVLSANLLLCIGLLVCSMGALDAVCGDEFAIASCYYFLSTLRWDDGIFLGVITT